MPRFPKKESEIEALAVPGQTRLLEAPKQGAGWLFLDWKKPSDGDAYPKEDRVK